MVVNPLTRETLNNTRVMCVKNMDNSLPNCNTINHAHDTSDHPSETVPNNLTTPLNFHSFFQPGLYEILCLSNGKRYIGEASSLASRISSHYDALSTKAHDCLALQMDWNHYGKHAFLFNILESGENPWKDRALRLKRERELCQTYDPKTLYNRSGILPIKERNLDSIKMPQSIPVNVYGINYDSVSAAARACGVSITTARCYLNRATNVDWVYADLSKRAASNVARPVVVDGKVFPSVSLASAHMNTNEKTVRSYIKKGTNWHYLDQLSPEEVESPLRYRSELANTNIGLFRIGRTVKVGEVVYPSIKKAAAAFDLCDRSVRKRVNSPNFPDWGWG